MENHDSSSSHGYYLGRSRTVGSSISHGKSRSESKSKSFGEGVSSGSCISYAKNTCISEGRSYAGTPYGTYTGDAAYIAQQIFRDEVRDALIVLKNCGTLRSAAEREWCVKTLQQLLLELFDSDMA